MTGSLKWLTDIPHYAPVMTRESRIAWRKEQGLPDEWFHDDETMYVKDEYLERYAERIKAIFEGRAPDARRQAE